MIGLVIGAVIGVVGLVLYVRADNARATVFRTASRELAQERQRAYEREREIYLQADARVAELVSQLLYSVGREWDRPPALRREPSPEPTPRQRTVSEAFFAGGDDAEPLIRSAFEA